MTTGLQQAAEELGVWRPSTAGEQEAVQLQEASFESTLLSGDGGQTPMHRSSLWRFNDGLGGGFSHEPFEV